MRRSFTPALLCALLALAACGPTDDDQRPDPSNNDTTTNSQSNNTTPGPSIDCATACPQKLRGCQFPEEIVSQCGEICANLSQSQLLCFDATTCEQLYQAADIEDLCPATPSNNTSGNTTPGNNTTANNTTPNNTTSGNKCASTTPTCEGNTRVVCDDSGGFPVTTRSACSRGCQSGECVGPVSQTTITGRHNAKSDPISVQDGGNIVTVLSFTAPLTSDPDDLAGSLDLKKAASKAIVPTPTCQVDIQLTLNRSELGFVLSGTDQLPATDCVTLFDKIKRDGVTVALTQVPELNSSNVLEKVTLISK